MPPRPPYPSLTSVSTWADLEKAARSCWGELRAVVHPAGPVLDLTVVGHVLGTVDVLDPLASLRAQDRRRLHRLGFRPVAGDLQAWSWSTRPPAPPPLPDVLGRMKAALALQDTCRQQLVAALRDGLRVPPDRVRVKAPDPEEGLWDDGGSDEGGWDDGDEDDDGWPAHVG